MNQRLQKFHLPRATDEDIFNVLSELQEDPKLNNAWTNTTNENLKLAILVADNSGEISEGNPEMHDKVIGLVTFVLRTIEIAGEREIDEKIRP